MKSRIAIVGLIALIGMISFVWLLSSMLNGNTSENTANGSNVTVVDGVQVIEITAKGGYSPRKTVATAGIPTVLKMETNGTFDCSSALYLPTMKISENLPPSGETEVDLGTPTPGTFRGTCSMGMYNFEIDFQS